MDVDCGKEDCRSNVEGNCCRPSITLKPLPDGCEVSLRGNPVLACIDFERKP